MKTSNRYVGQLIVSAPVTSTNDEATVADAARSAIEEGFTQLGKALAAYGRFLLGSDMDFVTAGVKVDVLDASTGQNADFDRSGFEAFVKRAHSACSHALCAPEDVTDRLAAGVEGFASVERLKVDAVKALFTSMAEDDVSLISNEGELIALGVAKPTGNKRDSDMEFEVARIRCLARIKTTNGQFDVAPEDVQDLKVGDIIDPEGVDLPTGATCIRADRIDTTDDPSGELFDDSTITESGGDPDDTQ